MFDINAIVNQTIAEAVSARITEVLMQHANIVGALAERIATLENDLTTLQESRGNSPANPEIANNVQLAHLDQQEWFWEKVSRFAGTAAESAVQDHLDEFDHNDYDAHLGDDDRHKDGDDDLVEAVKEALADCTVSLRVR